MERWIESWLGVVPSSMAVVSATLHLPLLDDAASAPEVETAGRELRRRWHDPLAETTSLSEFKRGLLDIIAAAPDSNARRSAFFAMHEQLARRRSDHREAIDAAEAQVQAARLRQANRRIANRRTWPFPLYPSEMIDELARAIAAHKQGAASGP